MERERQSERETVSEIALASRTGGHFKTAGSKRPGRTQALLLRLFRVLVSRDLWRCSSSGTLQALGRVCVCVCEIGRASCRERV